MWSQLRFQAVSPSLLVSSAATLLTSHPSTGCYFLLSVLLHSSVLPPDSGPRNAICAFLIQELLGGRPPTTTAFTMTHPYLHREFLSSSGICFYFFISHYHLHSLAQIIKFNRRGVLTGFFRKRRGLVTVLLL